MPKIHLPDGRVVHFPDGMPEADIAKALSEIGGSAETAPVVQSDTPAAEPRSVGGFLENVASSGGRFLKNTAEGALGLGKMVGTMAGDVFAPDPVKTAERGRQALALATNAPRILGAIAQGAKDRYGGVENIKKTLYEDPVGVLGDVSTLAGGVGLAGKVGGASKLARAAGAVSEATNPMRALNVVQPVATGAARAVVRGTLRPSAAVRKNFGGAQGVADAVLKNRVFSEDSAQRKLTRSVNEADALIAAKDAERPAVRGYLPPAEGVPLGKPPIHPSLEETLLETGEQVPRDARGAGTLMGRGAPEVPTNRVVRGQERGVHVDQIVDELNADPAQSAGLRAELGSGGGRESIDAQIANLRAAHPSGDIPLPRAQALKREAQDLAYEATRNNQGLAAQQQRATARALRRGIEQRVPEVGPVNQRSQELLGAKRAFAEAQDRPQDLTNTLAILGGGGGFATGGPVLAALLPALIKASKSPRAGAMAGIGINTLGQAASNPAAHRAALLARLFGQEE